MNLINEQVTHKSFGEGNIVNHTDSSVEISFPGGNKKFLFPDAFGTHLVLVNRETADLVDKIKQEIQKERKEEELELERLRVIEDEKRQLLLERDRLMKNHKISPAAQAVFWCDETEQDRVFTELRVSTGLKKSGPDEGKPNRLARLHQNSACLITAREPNEPERDRRVVSVFMVEEQFIGKLRDDGYIPAHSKYKLRLSDEESKRLLFWNYYVNERYPDKMTWNSGKYRYFDNVWMAQILQEIVSFKEENQSADLEIAQEFLEYFCQMNQLVKTGLPAPNGALMRLTRV